MSAPVHPGAALFEGEKPSPIIPSCEHYAGSEKLMLRALELQDSIEPVPDLSTCPYSRELLQKAKVAGVAIPADAHKALFNQRPAVALCVTPETVPMPDKALAFDLH